MRPSHDITYIILADPCMRTKNPLCLGEGKIRFHKKKGSLDFRMLNQKDISECWSINPSVYTTFEYLENWTALFYLRKRQESDDPVCWLEYLSVRLLERL